MQLKKEFSEIVRDAWQDYDGDSRLVKSITDISAKVSTNHVFMIELENRERVIGKLSYFGSYENFLEDHTLINALALNLPAPYEYFVSHSLTKQSQVYTYRYKDSLLDAWVVFYKPIRVNKFLPRKLSIQQVQKLGRELASFHKTCTSLSGVLPLWSKTMPNDLRYLLEIMETDMGKFEHRGNEDVIKRQVNLFLENFEALGADNFDTIPVFVDWNIGNFSIDKKGAFYSRWDYDWFRMSSRIMDFYFFSRVCSSAGDRTFFSYLIDPLMEPRFMSFLKAYHQVFPLTEQEVYFLKEAYRFFILNYVIKDGRYFFHEIYSGRLQMEAYATYFPNIDKFDASPILKELGI